MRPRVLLRCIPLAVIVACAGCEPPTQPRPPVTDPPAITCPAAVTVGGVTGGSQAVAFEAPVVTGGAQPVAITCTPASGASFPVGDTDVTCVAADRQARQASCSFRVTLTALQLRAAKFVAFGDSLTEGENGRALSLQFFQPIVDPDNAYPTQLADMLKTAFPSQTITLINAGRGGEKVTENEPRFSNTMLQFQPEVVLLLEGINDLRDGIEPSDIVTGLRFTVREARERGVPVVFVSTLLPGKRGRREPDASLVAATNTQIRPMVTASGAHLVDPYDTFLAHADEYIEEDGLHLTPAGNRALADAFFQRIKEVMATSPGVLLVPRR